MENLCFGSYMFDAHSVLSRDGEVVSLPPKEMALLKLLLHHDGAIVSLQMIEKEVWPRQTVSYASVARCVYSLRKFLGQGKNDYIASIPKRGYRFVMPVRREPLGDEASTNRKMARACPRAYSHFIEGLSQANLGTFQSTERAIELFREACAADPDYAVAHTAIADCLMFQSSRGYIFPGDAFTRGLSRCDRALEIDDQLASAHAARGWFYCVSGDMNLGFESLDKALSIDPDYARGYSYLSYAQRAAGLIEESIANARKAVELDPYSILHRHALAWRLFCSGCAEEALEIERNHMSSYPADATSHGMFGVVAAWMGIHGEALKATERANHLSGNNPGMMTLHTYTLARAGKHEQAKTLADSIETRVLPCAPASHLAMTYVALGDFDRALELLREAHDDRCPWFRGARFDPRLKALENDPRLLELYKNVPLSR